MEELIRITTREDGTRVVSAKELYLKLGYDKSNWSGWAANNITGNVFAMESEDWTKLVLNTSANNSYDYAITVDFAKRLCMMARTLKGEEIRRYFLECEKVAKGELQKFDVPKTFREALLLAAAQQELIEEQSKLIGAQTEYIQEAKPKVEYAEKVLLSESDLTTTSIASELGLSAIALNKKLEKLGVQRRHDKKWILYSKHQGKGYTTTRTYPFVDKDGKQKTEVHTVWTEKGREFIHKIVGAK